MYLKKQKNGWAFFLLLLAGIVVGGALGEWLGQQPNFQWLRYGFVFGIEQPFTLNLQIIQLTIGAAIKITISSLIGILGAILIFRRL